MPPVQTHARLLVDMALARLACDVTADSAPPPPPPPVVEAAMDTTLLSTCRVRCRSICSRSILRFQSPACFSSSTTLCLSWM